MDRLRQIETFVAVAAHGSFAAAAAVEGVAANLLGRRINALESRLGVRLLTRTTRRLSLTHEGAAYLEDCQRILQEIRDSEEAVTAGVTEPTGQLRITAPAGFGRVHVAPLVPAFVAQHPRVSVSLDLEDRVSDLSTDPYDLAVRIGQLEDDRVVVTRLADNQRLVVASPAYLARRGTPKSPRELQDHECLVLRAPGSAQSGPQRHGQGRYWQLQLDGRAQAVRVGGTLECNDGAVLHAWALAGLGLAWRSLWEVAEDLHTGRLISVLDAHRAPDLSIHALCLQRTVQPLRVRLFLAHLKRHYGDPAYWRGRGGQDSDRFSSGAG